MAEIVRDIEFVPGQIEGVGTLTGVATAPLHTGDQVSKAGRTTGTTAGRITAIEIDNLVVGYEIGDLRFDNQIEVEGTGNLPFSRGGDSGSLVVNRDRKAVGLLFAGSDTGGTNRRGLTFLNPIADVLNALNINLVTGP